MQMMQGHRFSILPYHSRYISLLLILMVIVITGGSMVKTIKVNGQVLGSSSTPYPELTNNGIECDVVEHLTFHTHTNLTMIVDEKQQKIPAGIGIIPAKCIYWLHTHDDSGLIHMESPINQSFTLGQFFEIWDRFDSTNSTLLDGILAGNFTGHVDIFVNGKNQSDLDYADIQLKDKDQITLHFNN